MGTVAALDTASTNLHRERVSVEITRLRPVQAMRQACPSCINYGMPIKVTAPTGSRRWRFRRIRDQPYQYAGASTRYDERCGSHACRHRGDLHVRLTELGGLVAGESRVVIGPGPIGLLAVAVAKALGASPVILTGTRGQAPSLSARSSVPDRVHHLAEENAVGGGKTAHRRNRRGLCGRMRPAGSYRQSSHPHANRGGKICLAAFPHEPVTTDIAHLVKNNIYVYGIRGEGRSATRRAMALMAKSARCDQNSYPLPSRSPICRPRSDTHAIESKTLSVVVTNRQANSVDPSDRRMRYYQRSGQQ